MAVVNSKRSIMNLYSGSMDIYSHRVRIALAEKGIAVEVIHVETGNDKLQSLLELNPYGNTPTLVDRDLVLYDTNIILEYLDERFPHPPLMPVYPVARAKTRLMIHRIDKDWGGLVKQIETGSASEVQAATKELRSNLTKIAPLFAKSDFFFNEEFSLTDCCLMPILWRLPRWGIILPADAKPLLKYAEKMFARDAFQASLTEAEQEVRQSEIA